MRDGDELHVGRAIFRAIETPGHTPESISWLVVGEDSEPRRVLTGDTLFIGDIGRPDLAGGRGYTPREMAAMLYDSLHGKLLALPDDVEVWPAHGAGSACGRNISRERSSTIGMQRTLNDALQPMAREAFVELMIRELPPAPRYFAMDAELNRRGARALDDVAAAPLGASDVLDWMHRGAAILDVRYDAAFGAGHLPGAINIGLAGQYASWAGTLLRATDPIVLVAGTDTIGEAIMRLARVGLENVVGYLDGGVAAWPYGLSTLARIDVAGLAARLAAVQVLDVRRPGEYANGHVPFALNVPLDALPESTEALDRTKPVAVICQSGYRSSAAASILQRAGFAEVVNVVGGTAAWIAAGHPTT